jgi:pyruvate formate lyase activating enzyme
MPYTDLVLFDLKLLEPTLHRKYTGVNNHIILENLSLIRDYCLLQTRPIEIWIRTPIIPGATDSEENLNALGHYIRDKVCDSISRWELCAFNNLCRDQYKRLGIDWIFDHTPLLTSDELACCVEIAKNTGVRLDLVHATGATQVI